MSLENSSAKKPSLETSNQASKDANPDTFDETPVFAPITPTYNLPMLQRTILNSGQKRNQTILALQKQYGNSVVRRVLANLPASKPSKRVVQRITDALPATRQNLEADSSLPSLKTESDSLNSWIEKTVFEDLVKNNSRLNTAKNFNPHEITKVALTSLWNFDFSDTNTSLADVTAGVTDPATLQNNLKIAREKTVEYHLIDLIRKELAASTARRLKREADTKVVRLRQKLAEQAAQIGKDEVLAQGPNGTPAPASKLRSYKEVILETYKNKTKKAEKLAAGINDKVAYEVSKEFVDENNVLVKKFLAKKESKNDFWALSVPIKEKIAGLYEKRIVKPEQSIRRKKERIYKLKEDIHKNSSMIGLTRYKYKRSLTEEAEKLVKADYEAKVFANAPAFKDALTKTAVDEASILTEPFKVKAGEAVRTQFKAGSLSTQEDNTTERHRLKAAITSKTLGTLKKAQRPDVKAGRSQKRQNAIQNSKQLVKKAQTETITDVLEGPVHSRLRYVGKALAMVVPQDGDKAKLEFTLKAPVGDPQGGGYLGMRLMGQIEHEIEYDEEKSSKTLPGTGVPRMKRKKDGNGNNIVKNDTYKVKAELALIGGYRVPFVFDVGGEIGGYLEIESNQSMERAMELLSFGFYRRFRESQVVPQDITNGLWGMGGDSAKDTGKWAKNFKDKRKAKRKEASAWGDAFQESLTDKEFVETGGFGAATGSGSLTDTVSIKGGLKGYRGKRYQKNTMAALAKGKAAPPGSFTDKLIKSSRERNMGRNMNGVEISSEVNVGPFSAGGKFKLAWMDNQVKSLDPSMRDKVNKYEKDLAVVKETLADLKVQQKAYKQTEQSLGAGTWLNNVKAQLVTIDNDILTNTTEKTRLRSLVEASLSHQLKRQMYSLEFELSGATKGGNFGSPEMIAAEVAKYAGELGSKTRATVMSFRDQYAKKTPVKNAAADLFGSTITGVEAGVNHAKNFDPTVAAEKLKSSKDLINTQKGMSYNDALHNQKALDKMTEFAVKSSSGLKLTLKGNFKRDFASDKPGVKFSKNYPGKVEFILDQVTGGSLGTQVAVVSLEKATRLFRIGVKYKDGNISLMTV